MGLFWPEPRDRLAARRIVSRRLLPNLPEDIGQNILRILAIAHNPQNERERDAVVARIKRIQRTRIFRCHAPNEFPVFLFNALVFGHATGNYEQFVISMRMVCCFMIVDATTRSP